MYCISLDLGFNSHDLSRLWCWSAYADDIALAKKTFSNNEAGTSRIGEMEIARPKNSYKWGPSVQYHIKSIVRLWTKLCSRFPNKWFLRVNFSNS